MPDTVRHAVVSKVRLRLDLADDLPDWQVVARNFPYDSTRRPPRNGGASLSPLEVCGVDVASYAKIVANAMYSVGVFSSARLAILLTDSVTVYKMAGSQLRCHNPDDSVCGQAVVDVSSRFKGD